jgi:hypothetical protein
VSLKTQKGMRTSGRAKGKGQGQQRKDGQRDVLKGRERAKGRKQRNANKNAKKWTGNGQKVTPPHEKQIGFGWGSVSQIVGYYPKTPSI